MRPDKGNMDKQEKEQYEEIADNPKPEPRSYGEELIYTVQATGGSDDAAVEEAVAYINKIDSERRDLQKRVERLEYDKAFYKAKAESQNDIAVERDRANLRRAASQSLAIIDRVARMIAPTQQVKRVVGRKITSSGIANAKALVDELGKAHRLLYLATNDTPPKRISIQSSGESNGKRAH